LGKWLEKKRPKKDTGTIDRRMPRLVRRMVSRGKKKCCVSTEFQGYVMGNGSSNLEKTRSMSRWGSGVKRGKRNRCLKTLLEREPKKEAAKKGGGRTGPIKD